MADGDLTMNDLRTAAQRALEALDAYSWEQVDAARTALRAALVEPENWELRRLRDELERCKKTCAATAEAWREEVALAEDVATHGSAWSKNGKRIDPMSVYAEPVQEPVAWRFEARHIDSAWAAAVTLKHPGPEGIYMRKVTPL